MSIPDINPRLSFEPPPPEREYEVFFTCRISMRWKSAYTTEKVKAIRLVSWVAMVTVFLCMLEFPSWCGFKWSWGAAQGSIWFGGMSFSRSSSFWAFYLTCHIQLRWTRNIKLHLRLDAQQFENGSKEIGDLISLTHICILENWTKFQAGQQWRKGLASRLGEGHVPNVKEQRGVKQLLKKIGDSSTTFHDIRKSSTYF